MENIISLKNLSKIYDGNKVVNSINLDIKKGQFVTFLGPSGCGKTTTLRMIAGFEMPSEGEVMFNGQDIANTPPHLRNVNTVFQKYALFPHYNVYKNIAFGLSIQRIKKEVTDAKGRVKIKKTKIGNEEINERVLKALKIVGLTGYEKRDVQSLSGGQQQRVAIARAIINKPEVLLLDEPLGALDLKMRQEMQLELKNMHKKLGITFIYVTHDQEEALTMSDTIVVMRDGLICQVGTPQEIYNDPINAYVADFIGESNILDGVMLKDKLIRVLGKDIKCVDEGFEENEAVDVVIRPEDIVIGKEHEGLVDGEIINCVFRGVHYEMTCKTNGFEILIHSTIESKIGDKISLNVTPFDIHIMKKEHYTNTIEVSFASKDELVIDGKNYAYNPDILFEGYEFNEQGVNNKESFVDYASLKAEISVSFTSIEIEDNENDAPISGNIMSMIYKGKNYIVTIKTDDKRMIYADTEYLWDDGDRIGVNISKDAFRLARFI